MDIEIEFAVGFESSKFVQCVVATVLVSALVVVSLGVAKMESAAAVGMSACIEGSERPPLLACQSGYIAVQAAVVVVVGRTIVV